MNSHEPTSNVTPQTELSLDQQIDALPDSLKESVSALVDGELDRSESAFLLKRMEHDHVLRGLWLRYQDTGSCLRGQALQLQPIDFTQAIMARIGNETLELDKLPQQAPAPRVRVGMLKRIMQHTATRYISAAAIAASVAVVTLSLQKQRTDDLPSSQSGMLALAPATTPSLPSPSVSTQPVASRIGAPSFTLQSAQTTPLAIDEFLREHDENIGGRSAIAPMVYRISEADASYLSTLAAPGSQAVGE
jgi:negative regulator of sigma E activity